MLLGVSCAAGPAVIPYDLTPMELIQRGQEASARNRFSLALQHYRTLLERFPHDLYFICAAEYEIAFLYYRRETRRTPWRRDFTAAQIKFLNLLERYDSPDAELLPPQFRVLSEIVLARIAEAGHPLPPPQAAPPPEPLPPPAPIPEPLPPLSMLAPLPPAEIPAPAAPPQDVPVANIEAIEAALERAAQNISRYFATGSRIAVFYIMPQDIGYSRRIEYFLNAQGFAIVDRAELDRIRTEHGLHREGAIDDASAARIGYLAGASAFLTVGVVGGGAERQLNLIAMTTTTADILGIAIEAL